MIFEARSESEQQRRRYRRLTMQNFARASASSFSASWRTTETAQSTSSTTKSLVVTSSLDDDDHDNNNNNITVKRVQFDESLNRHHRSAVGSTLRRNPGLERDDVLRECWHDRDDYEDFRDNQRHDTLELLGECHRPSAASPSQQQEQQAGQQQQAHSSLVVRAFRKQLEFYLQQCQEGLYASVLLEQDDSDTAAPCTAVIGLERVLSRSLTKDKRRRRVAIVHDVLQGQCETKGADPEVAAARLRNASLAISRTSTLLAHCFATMAYRVDQKNYHHNHHNDDDEEEEPPQDQQLL